MKHSLPPQKEGDKMLKDLNEEELREMLSQIELPDLSVASRAFEAFVAENKKIADHYTVQQEAYQVKQFVHSAIYPIVSIHATNLISADVRAQTDSTETVNIMLEEKNTPDGYDLFKQGCKNVLKNVDLDIQTDIPKGHEELLDIADLTANAVNQAHVKGEFTGKDYRLLEKNLVTRDTIDKTNMEDYFGSKLSSI